MRKFLFLIPVVLVLGGVGCSKCSPKSLLSGGGKKSMTVDEIGSTLAPAICEKYGSCNQGNQEFNKDQCLKDISAGIAENLKQAKDLQVDQAKLDSCMKAVKDSPCEALNSQAPPQGCEFLQ